MSQKQSLQIPLLSKDSISIREVGFQTVYHTSNRNVAYFKHCHDYYEIVFYLGTEPLRYCWEDQEYQVIRGDIILCNMFEQHMFSCQENAQYQRFSVGIEPQLLLQYSWENANLAHIFNRKSRHYPIYRPASGDFEKYMGLIEEYCKLPMGYGMPGVQRALIHQMLAYLYSDCCRDLPGAEAGHRAIELVAQLVRYIDQHLAKRILLEELSREVHYSVAYICRVFKEITGETLVQYIIKKRIVWAKQLLGNGASIMEAAQQVGFDNYSYFYKAFRKLEGMGPKEYLEQGFLGENSPSGNGQKTVEV